MRNIRYHSGFTGFQKVLLVLCAGIVIGAVFVTAWALTARPERVGRGLRHADPEPMRVEKKAGKETAVYSELGRLRGVTSDSPTVPIVITPFFTYPASDTAFFEELVQKKRLIRSIMMEYFALHSKDELLEMGENKVKDELIARINGELVLGKIDVLYFNEYIFLN